MADEKLFFVYIMTNTRRGVLYVGVTSALESRIYQHKTGALGGFTAKWGLKRLVWFVEAGDAASAFEYEKRLKRWRRAWKFALIERDNPEWRDLAEDWFGGSAGGVSGAPG